MEFKSGTWVRHPNQQAWGGQEERKVRILFAAVGEKVIDTRFVQLEQTEVSAGQPRARHQIRALAGVNMNELERLCNLFHEQFKNRRATTDDGRMVLNVLQDMKASGDLSRKTADQLFSWTQTGASCAEGVDLAQRICRLIYGRVPTRAEIEAAGL
jgi:hypothetical protein